MDMNGNIHGITVHGLAHQDIVVVIVGKDLLHGGGGTGLELANALLGDTVLLHLLHDLLEVG